LLSILIVGSPRLRQRIRVSLHFPIVTDQRRAHGAAIRPHFLRIARFARIVQLIQEDGTLHNVALVDGTNQLSTTQLFS
jgi:hypothetical protein